MFASSSDKFENGLFWETYTVLEHEFERFLDFVPYVKENKATFSYRLLNLIQNIGGYVDSAFKEMAQYVKFSADLNCREIRKKIRDSQKNLRNGKPPVTVPISLSLRAFESKYGLSTKRVWFKCLPERQPITPFKPYTPATAAPEWWEVYNGLKHHLGRNLKKANLENTLNALSSAFLLNAVHQPSVLRLYDHGIMNPLIPTHEKRKRDFVLYLPRRDLEIMLDKRQRFDGETETALFVYDYNQ